MVQADIARRRLDVLLGALANLRRYASSIPAEALRRDADTQYMVLHGLYVAMQSAIDLGLHALADDGVDPPAGYADVFPALAHARKLDAALAARLVGWAKFRNVVAHHYPIIDYARVHHVLTHELDDLAEFAQAAARWLDEAGAS